MVDPCEKLPGRDRKILKKTLKKLSSGLKMETESGNEFKDTKLQSMLTSSYADAVPFSVFCAWFGFKPNGIDKFF